MRTRSLWHSFACSWRGIVYTFRTQRNLKIHAVISLAVIVIGLFLRLDALRWAVLILTMALVMAAELVNTAIESSVDLITESNQPLARVAKDAAAGAVFLSAIAAVIIGLLILGLPLWQRITAG